MWDVTVKRQSVSLCHKYSLTLKSHMLRAACCMCVTALFKHRVLLATSGTQMLVFAILLDSPGVGPVVVETVSEWSRLLSRQR